jgi:hypothetical protein
MDKALEVLLASVTGGVAGAIMGAVLVYLCREWITERLKASIKHEYDLLLESHRTRLSASAQHELETLKAKLEYENQVSLEKLRADIAIQGKEQEMKMTGLHAKRMESLGQIFGGLHSFIGSVDALLEVKDDEDTQRDNQGKKTIEKLDALVAIYAVNRVFIPVAITKQIDDILAGAVDCISGSSPDSIVRGTAREKIKVMRRRANDVGEEIRKLLAPEIEP